MAKNVIFDAVEASTTSSGSEDTRRKLNPVKETFNLDDGNYTGVITEAFFYTDEHIMLKIDLPDNTTFLIVTTVDKIERHPYSQLLSQANAEYVEDLQNLKVDFVIKNNTADSGETYSNVKKISLAE